MAKSPLVPDILAGKLAALCKRHGLSQSALARKANIRPEKVCRYANRHELPTLTTVLRLADAVDEDVEIVFRRRR